jgi:hypothetical protein
MSSYVHICKEVSNYNWCTLNTNINTVCLLGFVIKTTIYQLRMRLGKLLYQYIGRGIIEILKSLWKVSEKSLKSLWKVSEKYLKSLWKVSEKYLKSIWKFSSLHVTLLHPRENWHYQRLGHLHQHQHFCRQRSNRHLKQN